MIDKKLMDRITSLQEKIDNGEKEKSRLEGRREQLMTQLKNDHGCSSIKSAEAEVEKCRKSIKQDEAILERGIKEVEDGLEITQD